MCNLMIYGKLLQKEVEGPGRLLGYRALHKKIREVHNLNVPRNLVYAMMEEVDPEGLDRGAKLRG